MMEPSNTNGELSPSLEIFTEHCGKTKYKPFVLTEADRTPLHIVDDGRGGRMLVLEDQVHEVPTCCRCWYCNWCGNWMGRKLRAKLLEVLGTFSGRRMVTLTLDPKRFEGPEAAYLEVGRRRKIGELMRELVRRGLVHTRRFCYALEFQQNGFPHWHVLIDAGFIDQPTVGDIWELGFVWVSKTKYGASHAGNYVTKYLIKPPRYGLPEWVLDSYYQIRRYGSSRGLLGNGARGRDRSQATPGAERAEEEQAGRKHRTIRERRDQCGKYSVPVRTTQTVSEAEIPASQKEGRLWKVQKVREYIGHVDKD